MRRTPPALSALVAFLAACARSHPWSEDNRREQDALRDAWTMTFVWFAVVVVLLLVLIVVRHRRKPIPALEDLFRSRRRPDLRQWQRELVAAAARWRAVWATRRDAEKAASAAALVVARAALVPEPRLGPPTIGLVRRFVLAFCASGAMAALYSVIVGQGAGEWAFLAVLIFGGAAFVAALIASFICAVLMSALPRHHLAIGAACGALSAQLAFLVLELWSESPIGNLSKVSVLITGTLMGFIVAIAEEASRQPIQIVERD